MARTHRTGGERPETRGIVEALLAAHPNLSAYGLGWSYLGKKTSAEREAQHQVSRDQMLTPAVLVEFELACDYIRHVGTRKTVNRRHSSYGWKHLAEDWSGNYICNGAMIAAAYHIGVATKVTDGPNPLLALKEPPPGKRNWIG